ncbi:MAG: sulfotransferase [Planctomycetota bacterium]|nr:sulfotransferase [Planctomycetota bacterium]
MKHRLINRARRKYGRIVQRLSNANPAGWPLAASSDVAPVFIVGSGRCGTTLLRRLLIAGGELQIGPELQGTGRFLQEFNRSARCRWSFVCWMAWFHLSQYYEWPAFGLAKSEVIRRLKSIEPENRSAAAILDTIHTMYASKRGGAGRWGDKSPNNSEILELIEPVFPRAQYIHALRDGVDVVHSMIENDFVESPQDAVQVWIRRVEAVDRFSEAHPGRVMKVHYEELVSNPWSCMSAVCEFLKLRWDPAWIDLLDHVSDMGDVPRWSHHAAVAQPVNKAAIGKGRAVLDDAMRRLMQPMNSLLIRHGYEAVS